MKNVFALHFQSMSTKHVKHPTILLNLSVIFSPTNLLLRMISTIARYLAMIYLLRLSISTDLDNASDGICADNISCNNKCAMILKMFLRESLLSPWVSRYDSIAKKFVEHNVAVSVEIGVGRGELSHYLLDNVKNLRIHHGIDPFSGGLGSPVDIKPTLKVVKYVTKRKSSVDWAWAVLSHLQKFGCRFRLHKGYSSQMSSHFPQNGVDCVIFDADHSYNGIVADVVNYAFSVRPGGLLIFDDYTNDDFKGVRKAVNELSEMNNIPVVSINELGNVMLVKPLDRPFNISFDHNEVAKTNMYRHRPIS